MTRVTNSGKLSVTFQISFITCYPQGAVLVGSQMMTATLINAAASATLRLIAIMIYDEVSESSKCKRRRKALKTKSLPITQRTLSDDRSTTARSSRQFISQTCRIQCRHHQHSKKPIESGTHLSLRQIWQQKRGTSRDWSRLMQARRLRLPRSPWRA